MPVLMIRFTILTNCKQDQKGFCSASGRSDMNYSDCFRDYLERFILILICIGDDRTDGSGLYPRKQLQQQKNPLLGVFSELPVTCVNMWSWKKCGDGWKCCVLRPRSTWSISDNWSILKSSGQLVSHALTFHLDSRSQTGPRVSKRWRTVKQTGSARCSAPRGLLKMTQGSEGV